MLYTAESVTPQHPDKVCDRISDAILDECLRQDPESRVAIETLGGHEIITICGELTTNAYVDIRKIVKGIVGNKYGIQINIEKQSHEIGRGVDTGGAGDQGIMVGYACSDNIDFIPTELYLARKLAQYIYEICPEDGKTQITINDKSEIVTLLASFNKVTSEELVEHIDNWLDQGKIKIADDFRILTNPSGDWSIGSFDADTGVTGRKIVNDAYGPRIPVGGGAFSGKDPSKVDRSAAYAARFLAKKVLLKHNAREVIVHIAYAIGVVEPIMGTISILDKDGKLESKEITPDLLKEFEPKRIVEKFNLKNPIYSKTAEWGAFGGIDVPWEDMDLL